MNELTWFKSSYSSGDGGECLEAALRWHRSSHSSGAGGQCVEVAPCPTAIHVRDSKQHPTTASTLSVPTTAWHAFLGLVQG
ncbi:DUF397 domain-containing protein [Streptomyces bauhiniae]|uniref:DUF397 domain-containing protein n=1 Tax=Streptomyces bauhiniae TaxID=2340725 RepID=UPI0033B65699